VMYGCCREALTHSPSVTPTSGIRLIYALLGRGAKRYRKPPRIAYRSAKNGYIVAATELSVIQRAEG
jgi:hypothetical protein